MKKTVVIHTDALRREYPANWLIAERLKLDGYRVFITSRLTTNRLVQLFPPDILILSHVFSYDQDFLLKLKARGTKIYANEVEGEIEGNDVGISGTYPDNINYEVFDGIFVWSHWSRIWLNGNRAVPLSQVHAIGCTRLSLLSYVSSMNTKPVIGFISRFEIFNPFDGRHQFENLLLINPFSARGESYLERNNVDAECFSIGMAIVSRLIDLGVTVIIRPHPNEDLKPYNLVQEHFGPLVKIDKGHDYANFLNQVTHILAPLSSAFTEPYLLKKPIISTLGMQKNKYEVKHQQPFSTSFSKAAFEPHDIDTAVDFLMNTDLVSKQDESLDKQLSSMYALENDSDPIEELISIITQVETTLSRKQRILNYMMAPFKLGIDLIYIVYCLARKDPVLAFRTLKQYHYNSLIHKPNVFMKNIRLNIK